MYLSAQPFQSYMYHSVMPKKKKKKKKKKKNRLARLSKLHRQESKIHLFSLFRML